MRRLFNFLSGALLGGFVGAAVALLLTPYSGAALRQRITEYTLRVEDDVRQAAELRRSELENELNQLRQSIPGAKETAE